MCKKISAALGILRDLVNHVDTQKLCAMKQKMFESKKCRPTVLTNVILAMSIKDEWNQQKTEGVVSF